MQQQADRPPQRSTPFSLALDDLLNRIELPSLQLAEAFYGIGARVRATLPEGDPLRSRLDVAIGRIGELKETIALHESVDDTSSSGAGALALLPILVACESAAAVSIEAAAFIKSLAAGPFELGEPPVFVTLTESGSPFEIGAVRWLGHAHFNRSSIQLDAATDTVKLHFPEALIRIVETNDMFDAGESIEINLAEPRTAEVLKSYGDATVLFRCALSRLKDLDLEFGCRLRVDNLPSTCIDISNEQGDERVCTLHLLNAETPR